MIMIVVKGYNKKQNKDIFQVHGRMGWRGVYVKFCL
jgi:hypothetical protein